MKNKNENERSTRGFLFTLLMLIILGFMLITVSFYVTTLEQKEIIVPEKFKTNAMKQMIDSVSEDKMNSMTSIIGLSAMNGYVLNIKNNQQFPATNADDLQTQYKYMFLDCTLGPGQTAVSVNDCDPAKYTFNSWVKKMDDTANQFGFAFDAKINDDGVDNFFLVKQVDYENISISYNATIYLSELDGTKVAEKGINVTSNFSIDGMIDLMVFDKTSTPTTRGAVRQIYFRDGYAKPADLKPKQFEGSRGKGWVFGPLVLNETLPVDTPPNQRAKYILFSKKYYDGLNLQADGYAGLILMEEPELESPPAILTTAPKPPISYDYTTSVSGTSVHYEGTCTATCKYERTREIGKCVDCLEFTGGCEPGTTLILYSDTSGNGNPQPDIDLDPAFRAYVEGKCTVDATALDKSTPYGLNPIAVPFVIRPTLAGGGPSDLFAWNGNGVDSATQPDVYLRGPEPTNSLKAGIDSLGNQSVLIDNYGLANDCTPDRHYLYILDNMRDAAICGYYVQNNDAPSFLDRLMGPTHFSHHADDLGIESFVIGEWAKDSTLDRTDHGYLVTPRLSIGTTSDNWLRGMPGCKNKLQCSADDTKTPIGQFGLSTDHIDNYLVDDITCKTFDANDPCTS
ncbi:Uncharacterised protein [Candidatus Gugararchaeum adminiculabundum]|nr:Uncharacterised protein [Candidatus Gugararchaeum adminiculabundum]